jgi:hypothetical protein
MIDYALNVAVGISAGIGALTSAILRGGPGFSVPTYLFVASFGGLLLFGRQRR